MCPLNVTSARLWAAASYSRFCPFTASRELVRPVRTARLKFAARCTPRPAVRGESLNDIDRRYMTKEHKGQYANGNGGGNNCYYGGGDGGSSTGEALGAAALGAVGGMAVGSMMTSSEEANYRARQLRD